jgi:DNA-binding winged helix-turn-helix (wHTH) protein
MHAFAHSIFEFEGFSLDVKRGLLRAGDRDLPLRPKSFEVLRYLVENPDRLLSKEELMQFLATSISKSSGPCRAADMSLRRR